MTTLLWLALIWAQIALALAACLAVVRMVIGPNAQDRVLALDAIYVTTMLLFIVINGHLLILMAVVKSFDRFPVDGNFLQALGQNVPRPAPKIRSLFASAVPVLASYPQAVAKPPSSYWDTPGTAWKVPPSFLQTYRVHLPAPVHCYLLQQGY